MTTGFDLEQVALRSEAGSVEELARIVAFNPGATTEKLARLAGLDTPVMQRLMTDREFRERITEVMTYQELDVGKERQILQRMLNYAQSADEFKEFERAATWVYRQGGMLRADRQEVDIQNNIHVSFDVPVVEKAASAAGNSYRPPDKMAGVRGIEDLEARTLTVHSSGSGQTRSGEGEVEEAGEGDEG